MKMLKNYEEQSYFLLRVIAGLMFSFHGIQKIFGFLTDTQPALWSQLWIGGAIELVAGIAIVLGLQTRVAAFVSSGEMAVAYFQFHWKFQSGAEFFPALNKGELAVLYCFVFLFIACRGGGIWSLDNVLMKPVKPQ